MNLTTHTAYPSVFCPPNKLLEQLDSTSHPTKSLIQLPQSFSSAIHQFEVSHFKQLPSTYGTISGTPPELPYKFFARFMTGSQHNPSKIRYNEYHSSNKVQNIEGSTTRQSTRIHKRVTSTPMQNGSQVNMPKRQTRDLWEPEEDAIVLHYITRLGRKWSHVAAYLNNRTGKQVRDRYLNYLQPNIRMDAWTPEEDEQLIVLYHKFGKRWCRIAPELPGRTEALVKNRFYTHIRHMLRRRAKDAKSIINAKCEEGTTTCLTKLSHSPQKEEYISKEEVLCPPCKMEEINPSYTYEPHHYKNDSENPEAYWQPQSYYEDLSVKQEKIEYTCI